MKKNVTKWQKKKYGKKVFQCKRDPVKGFCFYLMIWETDLLDLKPVDWYESLVDAKRDGWLKV